MSTRSPWTKDKWTPDPMFGDVWIKDSKGLDYKEPDLNGKYCSKLYTWLEVDMYGNAWMCCPAWLPYSIGNILKDSIEDIWNGPKAQELRNQIFTGKWGYCQSSFCPWIQAGTLPDITDVIKSTSGRYSQTEISALKNKSLLSTQLPTHINFSNDESCNLKCPSCRQEKILFTSGPLYDQRKKINDKIIETFLTTPTDRHFSIFVTGSGDPWASKIYREMLYNLDGNNFPNLEISMQTNGVMYTPKLWNRINKIHKNLRHCRISFDAATKETYEGKTRLNGDWDVLLSNCDFLDKRSTELSEFRILYDFVVQYDNYKEMKKYIELVQERFPNHYEICFSMVADWGTWSAEDYNSKCIWKEDHPEHQSFLECLKDPIFDNERVNIGNLTSMRNKALAQ